MRNTTTGIRKPILALLTALLLTPPGALSAADTVFDPCRFGAKTDGRTLCTEPIQKAIDACAAAGGGTVRLAGGKFLSGTIYLRSHVTGLKLRDVHLRTGQRDERPAVICDDVKRLVLDGLDACSAGGAAPAVRLIGCPGASIRNSGDVPLETRAAS